MSTLPASHVVDANKLDGADAIVELFEIALRPSGRLFLKPDNAVTWQGNTYEAIGMKLDGVSSSADDDKSRPRLQIANPEGYFSPFIRTGAVDQAIVTRIRVLRADLEADNSTCQKQSWTISRVVSLNKQYAIFELRDSLDGQFYILPARMFIPPQFPAVKLS